MFKHCGPHTHLMEVVKATSAVAFPLTEANSFILVKLEQITSWPVLIRIDPHSLTSSSNPFWLRALLVQFFITAVGSGAANRDDAACSPSRFSHILIDRNSPAVKNLHKHIPKTFSMLPETAPLKRARRREWMFEVFWGFGCGTDLERGISQRNDSLLMIFTSSQNIQSDAVMHGTVLGFTRLHNPWTHTRSLVCCLYSFN